MNGKLSYPTTLFLSEKEEVLDRLDEKINVNDFAEVIYLCKYVGDYNITKYGDKLMFENADSALVLKRL